MNISENIKYILDENTVWSLYKNKSYKAKIQKADKSRVYNVPDRPGVVYNHLEDSYAEVNEGGLVVTGAVGEMWPIGEGSLKKYGVTADELSFEPKEVNTIETEDVFCGIMISADKKFTLETDYGQKVTLNGNRTGIDHGKGDYIIIEAKYENGRYYPDFSKSGRIVNGAVFDKLYRLAGYLSETISAPFRPDEDNYIFVSYSHKDSERVFPIIKALYEKGFHIWYDEGIELCQDYWKSIGEHIKNCSAFLLFISENSVSSKFVCENELPYACGLGKIIVSCTLDSNASFTEKTAVSYSLATADRKHPKTDEKGLRAALEGCDVIKKYGERKAEGYKIRRSNDDILVSDVNDEFEYKVCSDGIEIRGVRNTAEELYIPEIYKGLPVVRFWLGYSFNPDRSYFKKIYFPKGLKEARFDLGFSKILSDIYVPDAETEIICNLYEMYALYENPQYNPHITVHCSKGSRAEIWSVHNDQITEYYHLQKANIPAQKTADEQMINNYAFCSYADDVRETAEYIIEQLKKEQCSVIRSGDLKENEKNKSFRQSKCMIAFVSQGYIDDYQIEFLYRAAESQKACIMYKLDDCELPGDLSVMLSSHQYLDIKKGTPKDRFAHLVDTLDKYGCRGKNYILKDYEYTSDPNGEIILTKYSGNKTDVKIPELIFGYPVKALVGTFNSYEYDEYEFDGEKMKTLIPSGTIKSISLPEGITKIGNHTFDGCCQLEDINIPSELRYIGECAFRNCQAIKSIVLPAGVKEIGSEAFSECETLSEINIPDGIQEIRSSTFSGCRSLKSIKIPQTVKKIGDDAFSRCEALSEINIPDGIQEIGLSTFHGCRSLKSIKIPQTVKKIETAAFADCQMLETIVIPDGTEIIEEFAFLGCTSLKSIVIPSSVTHIDETTSDFFDYSDNKYLFNGCKNLTVYCDEGSAAWKYCEENDIPHEPIT